MNKGIELRVAANAGDLKKETNLAVGPEAPQREKVGELSHVGDMGDVLLAVDSQGHIFESAELDPDSPRRIKNEEATNDPEALRALIKADHSLEARTKWENRHTQKSTPQKPLSKGRIIPSHAGKVPTKPDKGQQIENYMLERYGAVI